jgi:hypothetical protein
VLVLGTSLRPFDLSAFGFPGCSLQPGLVELGFKVAGTSGLDRGHARHDFGVPLAGAGLGTRVFGQWIVLATGPVLGGGTTETLAWSIR